MKEDGWYKQFGTGHVLAYYHILHIDESQDVTARYYQYDTVFRKIAQQQRRKFKSKWWMEQEIKNNITEISRDQVPFLVSF